MSIVESTIINVLNYSDSVASVSTQIKPDGYLFEVARDEQPFAIPLSFAEIRVVNSQSNIFREGILRFDPEFEQEVYEKLGVRDWEQILTDTQIREIILKPTKEGLERVVKITSAALLERVRGMLIMLENTGMYDISTRVKSVVSERHKELYLNKRVSEIKITPTVSENQFVQAQTTYSPVVDIEALKEELKKQLLAELLTQNNSTVDKAEEDKDTAIDKSQTNRGRPKTSK